jgi:hypothetical protein
LPKKCSAWLMPYMLNFTAISRKLGTMKKGICKILPVVLAFVFFMHAGCIHEPLRLDLDTYIKNKPSYAGQDIVITASLDDVLARYSLYENKTIEVAAQVLYYRSYGFWTWYLILEENGKKLRCYTHYYRIEPGWDAVNLLERAIHGKRAVTVLGILKKDGLDIERLTCDNETAITSFKPPRPGFGLWRYY